MSVKQFENNRWSKDVQVVCFRHKAALSMIDSGIVLDLGSGDGLFLSLLKEKGIKGNGLDISEEGISKTRDRGIEATVFDFNNKIPFPDNTFDTVSILDLLEHLYTPEILLREATRVSKKYVVVSVPNFSSLPARIQTLFGAIPENNKPNKGHIYWFNYSGLRKMTKESGLSLVEIRMNTFWQDYFLVGVILRFMTKIWPSLFALSFVVKLEKK
ncbi:MAG: class I SAM-dependent methyltransferase [Candidatus Paceibacterota bacterium]|jgi:methionine biosynthesis protein MetW